MELKDIARAVVEANREGRVSELLETLYASGVISVEAEPLPDGDRETRGPDALRAEHEERAETFELQEFQGPFLHGPDRFGVVCRIDAEDRETGERQEMAEIAVHTIEDGKVVKEEFFHGD